MTKYFKARVVLQNTIELNLAAEDEASARVEAKNLALKKSSVGAHIARIDIESDGETSYGIGVRVRHFVFGEGTITALERATGHGEKLQFRAAIQFDDSDEKHIHLPMPKDKMEVLGSK